jgi:5-hydroxyisourate hydrolase-like protein (transthyretin family)
MRTVTFAFSAVLIACLTAVNVHACSCLEGPSPCATFTGTPVVFVGKVINIEESKRQIQRFGKMEEIRTSLLAHFEIERAYKGIPENQVNINVGTGGGGGDCGYDFKSGERYIVFASQGSDGRAVYTGICSRTQPLPEGQNDVELIEALLKGKPETRIFGTVSRYQHELDAAPPFQSKFKGGAAGLKVEARDGANVFSAVTDEDGRFQIRDVPEGKYEIRPILLPTQSGYLELEAKSKAEIRLPQLCGADIHFLIQTNGVIRGRLFDSSGKLVPRNVEVSILTAESAFKGASAFVGSSTWTKDGGTYEFDGLLPGDYVVGAGLLHPPDWRSPYSRIYYPATTRVIEAQILHMGEGEKFNDIDIHLPPPAKTSLIRGVVFEADGKPAVKANIRLYDLEFGKTTEVPEVLFETNADGTFAVTGIEGRRYQVRAYRPLDFFAGTGIQSQPVEITTSDELKSVILTLNTPGIPN